MHIANTLKVNLNSQQKTTTSWLVTTIKAILNAPIQKLENPISHSGEQTRQQSGMAKILVTFNGDLGVAIAAQKDILLNYGSEFRDTAALKNYFYITRTGSI